MGDHWSQRMRVADLNGDGKADILAGVNNGDGPGDTRSGAGEVHIIRGRPFDSVCTVAPEAGPALDLCGPRDVTLDGSATVVSGCAKTPQYRWLAGEVVVHGWDTDPTVTVHPTETTPYRLEVRCGDCAGPCFGADGVLVAVDPDITPPDLGNTLRMVRETGDVAMSWASVSEARTYTLHRGTAKGSWPPLPVLEGITGLTATLPDVPEPPSLYYYQVAGASCSGSEGP